MGHQCVANVAVSQLSSLCSDIQGDLDLFDSHKCVFCKPEKGVIKHTERNEQKQVHSVENVDGSGSLRMESFLFCIALSKPCIVSNT